MEINQLPPGSPVEITISNSKVSEESSKNNEKGEDNVYLSSVFDVTKSGELILHMPTRQGHLLTLALNISYNVIINTHAGIFSITGLLVNKGKIENFPVYIFKPTTSITKVQRREYYRFDCMIPVVAQPISREIGLLPTYRHVEEAIMNQQASNLINDTYGTILDISGGGARFTANVDINTDSYMILKFELPTTGGLTPMRLIAKRVKSDFKEDYGTYEHRVEFVFKESDEREIIIKYIFDEERRLRKKNQG